MALAVVAAGSAALFALGPGLSGAPGPNATPSVKPASSQGMADTITNPAAVGWVTGGMALLFFLGWWMRRQAKHRARR